MIFCPGESQSHNSTLKTILSVEYFIRENSGVFSKTELWNALEQKIMYQSYKVILNYLIYSRKIAIQGRKVVFIGNENLNFNLESYEAQNHSSTLTTLLNIEEFIMQNSGSFGKTDLWKALPKKIMYQSYKVVLEYLIYSKQITIQGRKVIYTGGGGK